MFATLLIILPKQFPRELQFGANRHWQPGRAIFFAQPCTGSLKAIRTCLNVWLLGAECVYLEGSNRFETHRCADVKNPSPSVSYGM